MCCCVLQQKKNVYFCLVSTAVPRTKPTGNILWLHNALLYCACLSMYDGALAVYGSYVCAQFMAFGIITIMNTTLPVAAASPATAAYQQSVVSARCHRRRGRRRRRCVVAECKVWYVLCVCTICVYTHTQVFVFMHHQARSSAQHTESGHKLSLRSGAKYLYLYVVEHRCCCCCCWSYSFWC